MRNKLAGALLGLALLGPMSRELYTQDAGRTEYASQQRALKEDRKKGYDLQLRQDMMGSSKNSGCFASRTVGNYEKGAYGVFGLANVCANDSTKYSGKIDAKRRFGKVDGVLEVRKAGGDPVEFGIGAGFEIPTPKRVKSDLHVLPINFDTKNGYTPKIEMESFTSVDMGRNFYLENLTVPSFPYKGRPSVMMDFTVGKKISRNLSVQGRATYDNGWSYGCGLRYEWSRHSDE